MLSKILFSTSNMAAKIQYGWQNCWDRDFFCYTMYLGDALVTVFLTTHLVFQYGTKLWTLRLHNQVRKTISNEGCQASCPVHLPGFKLNVLLPMSLSGLFFLQQQSKIIPSTSYSFSYKGTFMMIILNTSHVRLQYSISQWLNLITW